jgi:hypothetical protein
MALWATGDKITAQRMNNPEVETITIQQQIPQDDWTNLAMSTGFSSGAAGTPPLRVRLDKEGYGVIEGYVERTTGSEADGTTIATGVPSAAIPAEYTKSVPIQIMDGTGSGQYTPGIVITTAGAVIVYGVRTGYAAFWVSGRYAVD